MMRIHDMMIDDTDEKCATHGQTVLSAADTKPQRGSAWRFTTQVRVALQEGWTRSAVIRTIAAETRTGTLE